MLMRGMIQRFFSITIISINLASCGSYHVKSDFESTADFSELRYYTWQTVPDMKDDANAASPLLAERIIKAVDQHLLNKNFKPTQSPESASILVKLVLESRGRTGVRRHPFEYSPALSLDKHNHVAVNSSFATYQFTENRISIELYLHETLTPVWQGSAGKIFTRSDADIPEATVKKVIDDIPDSFPP